MPKIDRPESQIQFHTRANGRPVAALHHARIMASSRELGWEGLHLEIAANPGWYVDDLMLDGHFVGINLGDQDIRAETRGEAGWVTVRMPPRTFWINPEGAPFSVHSPTVNYWAGAVIDGKFLDATIGQHYELRGGFELVDELLTHLMRALVTEVGNQGSSGPAVAKTLIAAFVTAVAIRQGSPAAELPAKGGLTARQLKSVLDWVVTDFAEPITVALMAQRVGLSPAHFSREFKRTTGTTPWGHIIDLRLERAQRLLRQRETISNVAIQCGFGDQAHLCRVFRQKLGISPSAYVRESRRDKDGREFRQNHQATSQN